MSEKKPLVVFSGGMDSSYMLWKELEKGDVYTCYFHGVQSQDKVPLELAARKKIIGFFENLTGNKVISDTVVTIGGENGIWMNERGTGIWKSENNIPPDHAWSQAHMWLFGSLYVSNGNRHSKLLIGNVMGDDIALHLQDQVVAWDHLQRFVKMSSIPLEFPLAYTSKTQILHQLPPKMLPLIWVCELPDKKEDSLWHPCNRCSACVTLLETIYGWEHLAKKNFRNYVESALVDEEVEDKK